MTQVVTVSGAGVIAAASYPPRHHGGHYGGGPSMTFVLDEDLHAPDASVLAMPQQPVRVLTAASAKPTDKFFGFHTGQPPYAPLDGVTCGWVRSHDSQLRWQQIETAAGVFDWAKADEWVNLHYGKGRDLVFTLFGTPAFYSARPGEASAYSILGLAAEPSDLTKWDTFCSAVASRYAGKIKYFEVWNEPNGTGFFTGTQAVLAQLVRRAAQAVKAVDATNKVLCPPVVSWQTTAGSAAETYFTGMMSASDGAGAAMKDWVDIVAVHLYHGGNVTSNLKGKVDRIAAAMATAGITGKPVWDTESAPISPDAADLEDWEVAEYLKRAALMLLATGIERTCYYRWDHATMGLSKRPAVVAARETFIQSLLAHGIDYAYLLWDGRVAYRSNGSRIII